MAQLEIFGMGTIPKSEFSLYLTFIVPLVAFLPAPLAYGVALGRANWNYRRRRGARREILKALEAVLGGQLTPSQRERIVHDQFRLKACEKMDAMRLAGSGRGLEKLVEIRGLQHVKAALSAGKGAVIGSAHFGSSSCCMDLFGVLGFPITVVARWTYNDYASPQLKRRLIRLLRKGRPVTSHLRRPNIERRPGNLGVAIQAAAVLRQNELVGIMLDHWVVPSDRARPIEVNFLNGKARMVPGAITIAQLTGSAVLIALMRRSSDWRHQVLEISPPISLEADPATVFQATLAIIETAIRRYPAHWMLWKMPILDRMGLLSQAAVSPYHVARENELQDAIRPDSNPGRSLRGQEGSVGSNPIPIA